jgi:esterase/lipase
VWEEEMHHAYTIAKGAANNNNVPLFFIGYSLGALLGQALMCTSAEPCGFDKQVLMAPATAIRSRGYIIKHLFFLRKKLMLPSFSPQLYRANNFLPLTVYEILFRNEQQILAAQFSKLNIPTLVFIDPEDELISYKKLVNFVQTFKLTNYEIITLDSNLQSRYGRFHHLVVSEHTMGKQNWKMVTGRMATFLFGATKEQ